MRHHRRGLLIAVVAALLMTFVGGFGTGGVPFGRRLGYWTIIMVAGALIGMGASAGVRSWGRLAARPTLEGALMTLLISAPLTLVALGATSLFFDFHPSPTALVAVVAGVVVVTATITAVNYLTARSDALSRPASLAADREAAEVPSGLPEQPSITPTPPRLLLRLPSHRRLAEVIALESEDHYVRVHAIDGSDLVLLRLGDAIAELDGLIGERVHRSWWVARDKVVAATRTDGRGDLTLVTGLQVPVSRSSLPVLQAGGWFQRS